MKLVVRSVPGTIITQYMLLNSIFCSVHFFMYLYILPWSAAHSLLFTLTMFSLISRKVKVNSEHLFKLLNYSRPSKNIQLHSQYHGPF